MPSGDRDMTPHFAVTSTTQGTTHTVSVDGEVDVATVGELQARVDAALIDRPEILVVDLSQSTFIDSAGMRALVVAQRRAEAEKTIMVVVPGPAPVQRALLLCGLDSVLSLACPPENPPTIAGSPDAH